jgi:hypothetical protein
MKRNLKKSLGKINIKTKTLSNLSRFSKVTLYLSSLASELKKEESLNILRELQVFLGTTKSNLIRSKQLTK